MRIIKYLILFLFFFTLLYSQSTYRYTGGEDDGYNLKTMSSVDLEIIGIASAYRYTGGDDDGYNLKNISSIDLGIIGIASAYRYIGGNDDGYNLRTLNDVDMALLSEVMKLNLKIFLQGAYR